MITLDNIRKDLGELLETEKNLKHVEVHADTLDEALADAAVQLNTKVVNLEYEVKEKGYEGFFGIAKKPWTILVYQNPEVAAKIAKEKEYCGSDNEEHRCYQYNFALHTVFFEMPLVCTDIVPGQKSNTAHNN